MSVCVGGGGRRHRDLTSKWSRTEFYVQQSVILITLKTAGALWLWAPDTSFLLVMGKLTPPKQPDVSLNTQH